MASILKTIFYFGPLIFAFGFLAPLSAEVIKRIGWEPPYELSPLAFSLLVAGTLGVVAQLRGRWL